MCYPYLTLKCTSSGSYSTEQIYNSLLNGEFAASIFTNCSAKYGLSLDNYSDFFNLGCYSNFFHVSVWGNFFNVLLFNAVQFELLLSRVLVLRRGQM